VKRASCSHSSNRSLLCYPEVCGLVCEYVGCVRVTLALCAHCGWLHHKQTSSDSILFATYMRFVHEFGIVPNLCPAPQADAVFRMVSQADRCVPNVIRSFTNQSNQSINATVQTCVL
jgi:hypothetical protein